MNDAKKYIVSVLILLVAGMFGGCIKEDYSDCPRPFRLTVRAWDADMQDITETGAVQRVVIFVFDETGRRIDRLMMDAAQVAARKPIPLEYDGPTTVSFVAWANPDDHMLEETANVQNVKDLFFRLSSTDGIAQSPGDLFSGVLTCPIEYGSIEQGTDQTVDIYRRTAQVHIIIRGYQEWLDANGPRQLPDYADILLGETPDTYTGLAELIGNAVQYRPDGQIQNRDFISPIFRVYPTLDTTPLHLKLYAYGQELLNISTGSDGVPFIPVIGKMLNIYIDLRGANLNVLVSVTPWDVVQQYAEY